MKLIIDISEGIYKHIDTIQNGSIGAKQIINSVKNGIPAYKVISSARPKIGYWIVDLQTATEDYYICSECGRRIHLLYPNTIDNYPYCHCGTQMVKPQKRS